MEGVSKIAAKSNVLRCHVCKTNKLQGNMTFFYCCEPIKLDKLVCVNCQKKINCKACHLKMADKVIFF